MPSPDSLSSGDHLPPAVSIIIPHYNDLQNLDACLARLQQQSFGPARVEIIVADNNSRCDRQQLESICRDRCRLIDAPLQGAAAARNAGVAAASAPLLAFIDSDCRPDRGWLGAGVSALEHAPLVGGSVRVTVRNPQAMTPTEAFERIFAFNNERYVTQENFSVTANLFTTRDVFTRVGGFRPKVSEDLDWGRRAVAAGYRWAYVVEAAVEHPARRDWGDLIRKWRRLTAESFHLATENGKGRTGWLIRSWAMLASTPLAVLQIVRTTRVSTRADRFAALGVLIRLRFWRLAEAHRFLFLHSA